jgi:hypothetical protein
MPSTRARVAGVATGLTVLVIAPAVPAHASNPYTATRVCGASYTKTLTSHDLSGKARVYLLYSKTYNQLCATTIKTTKIGSPSSTAARLKIRGGSWRTNSGNFTYYAGPVYVNAGRDCPAYAGGHDGSNWTSAYQSCIFDPTYRVTTTGVDATCSTHTAARYSLASYRYWVHFDCRITDTSRDGQSASVQSRVNSWPVTTHSNTNGSGWENTISLSWVSAPGDEIHVTSFAYRAHRLLSSGSWMVFYR